MMHPKHEGAAYPHFAQPGADGFIGNDCDVGVIQQAGPEGRMVIETLDAKINTGSGRVGQMDDRMTEARKLGGEIGNGRLGSANGAQIRRFHRVVDDGAMNKNDAQFQRFRADPPGFIRGEESAAFPGRFISCSPFHRSLRLPPGGWYGAACRGLHKTKPMVSLRPMKQENNGLRGSGSP